MSQNKNQNAPVGDEKPLEIPTPEPGVENGEPRVERIVKDEDGDGKADAKGPSGTVKVFEVLIERSNNEKVATEVMEFEIPVLKALHGEFRVAVGDNVFDVEYKGDANDAFAMLKTKYNNNSTGDVVSQVYRSAKEVQTESGLPLGEAKQASASDNVDNRRKAKK